MELSDAASVEAATAATVARHGRIDILVNNAGITGGNGLTWELDPDVWRRVIEVNLTGCFLTCRSVVPHMLTHGYGRIVNVASIAGKEGNPTASHYSASKAGLIGFTKSLAKELATKGHPGQLHHPRRREDRHLQPDETGAHRLHARADSDGALRGSGRDRRADLLAGVRGVLVLHRGRLRHQRRPGDVLTGRRSGRTEYSGLCIAMLIHAAGNAGAPGAHPMDS